jgi:hypothetical protein
MRRHPSADMLDPNEKGQRENPQLWFPDLPLGPEPAKAHCRAPSRSKR